MNTENISFCSNVSIAEISARRALPKYKASLTDGLSKTVKTLLNNGVDDEVVFNFKAKPGSNQLKTDVLEISYFAKKEGQKSSTNNVFQSSTHKSITPFEKLTPKNISKKILEIYENLKKSQVKNDFNGVLPKVSTEKIVDSHYKKIDKLLSAVGFDDWTCL